MRRQAEETRGRFGSQRGHQPETTEGEEGKHINLMAQYVLTARRTHCLVDLKRLSL